MRLRGSHWSKRLARLRPVTTFLALGSLVLGLLAAPGCAWTPDSSAAARGFYYTVKRGDNLYQIGRRYNVPPNVLKRVNKIDDVSGLRVGQKIYIPRRGEQSRLAGRTGARGGAPPASGSGAELKRRVRAQAKRNAKLNFVWPLSRTKLTSRFGRRNGKPHEGIDLAAKKGTPIRAAEAGRVIHSGRLGAYGNVVILKHTGDYRSVYAHARKLFVRKGEFVEKAQRIAEVGMTGRTTGPHLHFEITRNEVPKDPLLYLP